MIKKLTLALLLFVTGSLFGQITALTPTTFLIVDASGNVIGELLVDPLALPGVLTVTGALNAKDSIWIGTFEGSVFGDLNIKQTTSGGIAIRIEEASGQEAYGIGVSEQGDFALHDDDGSLTFWIRDGTNQVIVVDSLRVIRNSRVQGDAKFEANITAVTYETDVTAAELGYVSEVTSDIQAQIDASVEASVTIGQTSGNYVQDTLDAVLDSALTDLVDTGGTIFIKGGTYYISASDSIMLTGTDTVAKHIYIIGEPGRTIINVTCNTGSKYAFVSTAARALQKLHFRDIEFIGDANALGIFAEAGGEADSVSFENCTIRTFTNASAAIFSLNGCSFWKIQDCDFIANNYVQAKFVKFQIDNCRFIASVKYALSIVTGGSDGIISNCLADGYGSAYTAIGGDAPYITFVNNIITRSDSAGDCFGIYLDTNADYCVVENNYIGNVSLGKIMMGDGIYIAGADCLISGNYVYGARLSGAHLTATGDGSFVGGNRFENCVTGITFDGGCTKAGHTENIFHGVGTNVTDGGTSTVNGDTRDLD